MKLANLCDNDIMSAMTECADGSPQIGSPPWRGAVLFPVLFGAMSEGASGSGAASPSGCKLSRPVDGPAKVWTDIYGNVITEGRDLMYDDGGEW